MHIHLYRLEQPLIRSARPPARGRIGGIAGPTVAAVAGDLDLPAIPTFLDAMNRAVSESQRTVIVDLSRVDFVGISGVQALAEAQDRANCAGLAMLLVHDGPIVSRALDVTGTAHLFQGFPTVRAALDARRAELAAHVDLGTVQDRPLPA